MGINKRNVLRLAGAYVAWVMGSGFATGQEILQFFTSYGYMSFVIVLINGLVFWAVGSKVLSMGKVHENDAHYDPFTFFCGGKLGIFYSWLLPISLFAAMIILISGSGETLHESFGIDHYLGALLMALLAFGAYLLGFQRFVKAVSFIGPAMIVFILLVGGITLFQNNFDISQVTAYADGLSSKQPVPFWWLAALLYGSYNLCGGAKYYTMLGTQSITPRDAKAAAVLGTVCLMLAILIMNAAMLTEAGDVTGVSIPTLYLAKGVSPILSVIFSVMLVCSIFSSCSAVLWTVCEKFVTQGTKKSYVVAALVAGLAYLGGLLPFASLVGVVYTAMGFAGLLFILRVLFFKTDGR